MVKHNNVVPNQHFHKDWKKRVRVNLSQPMRKVSRAKTRQVKAMKVAPRPVNLLRPVVHCPTQRYNVKVREGKGFTLEELKEAGVSKHQALSIGIAVDYRRRNKSVESLQLNVDRLKQYMTRLVVFPRKSGSVKKGDATKEELQAAEQVMHKNVLPIDKTGKKEQEYMAITDDMKTDYVREVLQAEAVRRKIGKDKFKTDDDDDE